MTKKSATYKHYKMKGNNYFLWACHLLSLQTMPIEHLLVAGCSNLALIVNVNMHHKCYGY